MDKKHLPYNVLLVIAAAAIGLMAICTFGLRASSFAVTVGYALPQPEIVAPPSEAPSQAPPPRQAPVREVSGEPSPQEADGPVLYEEPEGRLTSVQFPLDLNEASYSELLFIPGVGDVMAQRITQYRDHLSGGYSRMDQLMEIKGIGAGTYRTITAYLFLDVGEEPAAEPEETSHDDEFEQDEFDETTDWEESE